MLLGWREEEAWESQDHAERLPGLQRLHHLSWKCPHHSAEPRGALESVAKQHGITHQGACTVAAKWLCRLIHWFDCFSGRQHRQQGGRGVGVTAVQSVPGGALWPHQYRSRQEAHGFLQRPRWVQIIVVSSVHNYYIKIYQPVTVLLESRQVSIMFSTRASVGHSACWRVRESLWSGSRGRNRRKNLCPWWRQPVQVIQRHSS